MMRALAVVVLVGACTSGANGSEDTPPGDDGVDANPEDSPGPAWTSVGLGVAYQRVNSGNAIVIAYGGYSAKLSYSAAWATELVDAKLGGVDVGQIYAVQGPRDPGYNAREIQNTKLRAHLQTMDDGTSPIYVVAHSSGTYVAHELFTQLHAVGNNAVLSRITYANLDGGGSGLTSSIVDTMHQVEFVYAHDPTLDDGYSENYTSAESLAADYAPQATSFQVQVSNTGCDDGAGWCMHDVVITHRPHHSWSYDLADDYTDFVNRPITTEYLDPLTP
jgi:hypothetical protein